MKYFANEPDGLVAESIDGMLALHANRLARLEQGWPNQKVVVDRERHKRREAKEEGLPVAVLCGGGSGHEPAFPGFVGSGMLSAAVAGDLFASPPTSAVLSALRNTITESGALVVVLCYTGDRLNFGAAVEAIRIETGLDARMVIVSDDVALRVKGSGEERKTSARGLAGTMLVLKAAGAAAAAGLPLDDVERVATLVADSVTTMGVSLTPCSIPGQSRQERSLNVDEMELGMGAHGEPGAIRSKLQRLDTIVETVVTRVGCIGDFEDSQKVERGSDVVILVNNTGGTTMLEFSAVVGSVRRQAENLIGCNVVRLYAGTYLSSLDMKGFSVSLLRIPEGTLGEDLLGFLDAPTSASAWTSHQGQPGPPTLVAATRSQLSPCFFKAGASLTADKNMESVREAIERACTAAIQSRDALNNLDATIGDGDCGSTFARGGAGVRDSEEVHAAPSLKQALATIADVAGEAMGGSSGALLKIFFSAMASELRNDPDRDDIARAITLGVSRIMLYGGATQGDATMLDSLIPLSETLNAGGSWKEALAAAAAGCEATKAMTAKAGRASYVPGDSQVGISDPGATAVVLILQAILKDT